jgi:hypothetical protein
MSHDNREGPVTRADEESVNNGAEAVPPASEVREETQGLVDLVFSTDTSVRLRNALLTASAQGTLPFATVRSYLQAGEDAVQRMMQSVRHLGRKTARELDAVVNATAEAISSPPLEPWEHLGPKLHRMIGLLGEVTLGEAIAGEVLSVRLENGLADHTIRSVHFADVVGDLVTFLTELRRRDNIGRTTLNEMAGVVRSAMRRALTAKGVSAEEIQEVCLTLFDENGFSHLDAIEEVPASSTLEGCIEWLLERSNERDRAIIERRFGIRRTSLATLEEIGAEYRVTRERIRQIEKRSLRAMRTRMRRIAFDASFSEASTEAWLSVSEGRGWISDRQAESVHRVLDHVFQLALALRGETALQWLSSVAVQARYGWIGPPLDLQKIKEAADGLTRFSGLPLPRPLPQLLDGADRILVEAAIRAELGQEVDQGYVVQARPGRRMRRALGLHRILSSAGVSLSVGTLVRFYHGLSPADPCSARDADIVMRALPHMFVETFDQVWFALGSCSEKLALDGLGTDIVGHQGAGEPVSDETCAAALVSALARRGPERLVTLYQHAGDVLPPDRSQNSIGPTLMGNPHLFVRLLPGVYGLHHQVPASSELLAKPPAYLLDNTQLRLMALALRAGERRDVFPLWCIEGEMALVRWGRQQGSKESFRSLLKVADVDKWPVSSDERSHWKALAIKEGRFELEDAPRPGAYALPDLDRVLSVCIEGEAEGRLNWMAINRMSGRRIDSQASVGMMAILIALGVIESAADDRDGWQLAHRTTDRISELRARLAGDLSFTGTLVWDTGLGLGLRKEIEDAIEEVSGWPSKERVRAMLSTQSQTEPPSLATAEDPLDAILLSARESAESRKREELIRWLLEE